jgi:hypothetical protein
VPVLSGAGCENPRDVYVVESRGRVTQKNFAKSTDEGLATDSELRQHVLARSFAVRKLVCHVIVHGLPRSSSDVQGSGAVPSRGSAVPRSGVELFISPTT